MEQTATLMVDNGEVVSGKSPGKLRQLNTANGLYVGKFPEEMSKSCPIWEDTNQIWETPATQWEIVYDENYEAVQRSCYTIWREYIYCRHTAFRVPWSFV